MTNPFGEVQYDRDGLPITPKPNPYADPFSQPQSGFANPMSSPVPQTPIPQQPAQFANFPTPYSSSPYGMAGPMIGVVQKDWMIAWILAFFLGPLGAHNFYLGYTGRAVAQLLLTVLGWITLIFFVGAFAVTITGIWAFVEFIMILVGASPFDRDANGVPLRR